MAFPTSGALLAGASNLVAAVQQLESSQARLTGAGALTVFPIQRQIIQSQFSGTGSLSVFIPVLLPPQTLSGAGSLLITSTLVIADFASASLGGSGGLAVAVQLSPSIRHYDPTYWGTDEEVMITANDNDGHMLIVEPGTLVGRPPTAVGAGRAEIITPLPPLVWSGDTLSIDLSSINAQIATLQQQLGILSVQVNPQSGRLQGSGRLTCNATGGHNWGAPTACALFTVQGISAGANATIPLTANVPAGALLIISILSVPSLALSPFFITDSKANSYDTTSFASAQIGSSANSCRMAFANNVNALTAGIDTISLTNSATSTATFIVSGLYVQGQKTTAVFELSSNSHGITSTTPTGSLTYAADSDLIVAIIGLNGAANSDTFTQQSGFYSPPLQPLTINGVARLAGGVVVSQPGQSSKTYAPTITRRDWTVAIAAFKSS